MPTLAQQASQQARLDELTAYEARTRGMEQRLAESVATADEMAEAARRRAPQARDHSSRTLEELHVFARGDARAVGDREEDARGAHRRRAGRARGPARRGGHRRSTRRSRRRPRGMTEAHEAELAQLREAHERSVSTLRGELEPKVIRGAHARRGARAAREPDRGDEVRGRAHGTRAHRRARASAHAADREARGGA